jgi:hypothetical protein
MRLVLLLVLAACSKGNAKADIDAAPKRDAANDGPDASTAYRHTIQIDGVDDFLSAEQFPTTSAGYDARVTWDDDNVYVGYSGTDLDPATADTATKWLFVYLDSDPGAPNGALVSETYNTQGATFPTGFRADYYVRWKSDATLLSLKQYNGATWDDHTTVPPAARGGSYVEIAIPRAAIGGGNVHLVTWMINEKPNEEGTYAGLYAGHFVDGYHANLALAKYLKIDFGATRDPNDVANQGP